MKASSPPSLPPGTRHGQDDRPPESARAKSEAAPGTSSLARRLGWLVLLWLASVASLGVVALLIRLLMHAAGMRS